MIFPKSPLIFCVLAGTFLMPSARAADTMSTPVEDTSSMRSQILLNGTWQFSGGEGAPDDMPAEIRVPGSWSANPNSPIASGVTAPNLAQGIYQRSVEIPSAWAGRRILLDLRRVSTQAEVSVNGKSCGTVEWPYGQVDITKAVQPGAAASIQITVDAKAPEGEKWSLMGYATEAKTARTLDSRGLIGDVLLISEPAGPRITDVFVKPSVRKKALDLSVELADAIPGEWKFTARMLDEKGNEEKVIEATANVASSGEAAVELSLPWENPRLWDLNQPNLYTLLLEATPPGATKIADAYPQTFGFREFWIEGRDFVLNGKKVRLRPRGGHGVPSHPVEMKAFIDASRDAGFNISQIWPQDALEPGQWNFWELFAEEAGKQGWAIIGALPSVSELGRNKVDGVPIWTAKPDARTAWVKAMDRELKRYRNFPSILIWGSTGNLNNHFADQDPAFLGQKEKLLGSPQWPETEKIAQEAIGDIKKADPTRPAFIHAGSRLGDIFTVNHYLNLLPLQEREEMLSEYMIHGDVPYIGIEFGTPLNTTMNRGRAGFGPSHVSEPFATEYASIYLGSKAYELEPRSYRRNVRFGFTGKDWGGDWSQMQWDQSSGEPFQELQALFYRNTWRSWRAAGVTGGMIPWNDNNQTFLLRDKGKEVSLPEPPVGQRGPRPTSLKGKEVEYMKPEGGWVEKASAKALREVNGPELAFIGGPEGTSEDPVAFTAKDHSFRTGQRVAKSAVLINDARDSMPFSVEWSVTCEGKEIATGKDAGSLDPATNRFVPMAFDMPAAIAGAKAPGEIHLKATIGETEFTDTFPFHVFAQPNASGIPPVVVFDPKGQTSAMLAGLGIKSVPWDGKPSNSLLVIGREALSPPNKLPAPLLPFVEAGGRVLIFAQTPSVLRDGMGFRLAEYVSRRAFPVSANQAALAGLDADDFRDWSTAGTLREAKPAYDPGTYPEYGWHWGNRGSVSSAMPEKPHQSGWRPILEGEFDLAYSPLMELDRGKGRAILCTLDVEDAWKSDPAAALAACNLIRYAATAPLSPSRATVFIGSDADFQFLTRDLGVIAQKAATLPSTGAGLAIVGAEAKVAPVQLETYARNGGNVLVLAQKTAGKPGLAGGDLIQGKSFHGSAEVPTAPAARGLGASDIRFRSDLDWTVFKKSPETQADGLLQIRDVGRGTIVQAQFEPRWFDTEKLPMFRLTRWRHTRALSQLIANLGGQFAADATTLAPTTSRISLAGPWKVKITTPLPNTTWEKPHTDPGISAAAQAAVKPDFDDKDWETWNLPSWYPPLEKQNGEVVWRKTIEIPAEWEGKILQIGVARVKAFDTTYLNGTEIGKTGASTKDAWNQSRRYRIPGRVVKPGPAVIAIREFSPDFQGGIHGRKEEMFVRPVAVDAKAGSLYHSDYREEFDFGDNPYRYYRW